MKSGNAKVGNGGMELRSSAWVVFAVMCVATMMTASFAAADERWPDHGEHGGRPGYGGPGRPDHGYPGRGEPGRGEPGHGYYPGRPTPLPPYYPPRPPVYPPRPPVYPPGGGGYAPISQERVLRLAEAINQNAQQALGEVYRNGAGYNQFLVGALQNLGSSAARLLQDAQYYGSGNQSVVYDVRNLRGSIGPVRSALYNSGYSTGYIMDEVASIENLTQRLEQAYGIYY